jgi:hypothetical protein
MKILPISFEARISARTEEYKQLFPPGLEEDNVHAHKARLKAMDSIVHDYALYVESLASYNPREKPGDFVLEQSKGKGKNKNKRRF